jgi:hypothetical protein
MFLCHKELYIDLRQVINYNSRRYLTIENLSKTVWLFDSHFLR